MKQNSPTPLRPTALTPKPNQPVAGFAQDIGSPGIFSAPSAGVNARTLLANATLGRGGLSPLANDLGGWLGPTNGPGGDAMASLPLSPVKAVGKGPSRPGPMPARALPPAIPLGPPPPGGLPNTFEFPKIPSADQIEKMNPVQRRNLVASLLQNIPVVSFLDTIGYAEGADYNSLYGDHPAHKIPKWKFTDYSKHPGGVGSGGSSVSGRYQFKDETYALYAPKLGISDFSPRSQDMLAVYLLLSKGEFPKLANGDFRGVVNKRSKTWASFPTASGISYYSSQPAKSIEKLESFYTARRSFHKNNFLLSEKKKTEPTAPTYPSGFLDGRTFPYPVIILSL